MAKMTYSSIGLNDFLLFLLHCSHYPLLSNKSSAFLQTSIIIMMLLFIARVLSSHCTHQTSLVLLWFEQQITINATAFETLVSHRQIKIQPGACD